MTSERQRGRGRPRGSGLNDAPVLIKIAEMIVRRPKLRPTTALRRIDPDINPASKRRIQSRWRAQGARFLAQAYARLAPREADYASAIGIDTGSLGKMNRRQSGAFGNSKPLTASQLAAGAVASKLVSNMDRASMPVAIPFPAMQAMVQLHDSSVMRAMREMHDSPVMRAVREMRDSPVKRAAREFHESPAMRAIQQLQNSPALKAVRDAQARLRPLGLSRLELDQKGLARALSRPRLLKGRSSRWHWRGRGMEQDD